MGWLAAGIGMAAILRCIKPAYRVRHSMAQVRKKYNAMFGGDLPGQGADL
jgi:hypothetical protein